MVIFSHEQIFTSCQKEQEWHRRMAKTGRGMERDVPSTQKVKFGSGILVVFLKIIYIMQGALLALCKPQGSDINRELNP